MPIIIGLFILILDQLSKYVYVSVCGAPSVSLIDKLISLSYVQNRGAAWGLFADHQLALYIISGIVVALMILIYARWYKRFSVIMRFVFAAIIAGALGNMIDRIGLGYVRDMIEFTFIDFPIFNIADAAICCGSFLLVIDCLFIDKKIFLRFICDDDSEAETPSHHLHTASDDDTISTDTNNDTPDKGDNDEANKESSGSTENDNN